MVGDTLAWDADTDPSVSTDTCNSCWVSIPAWNLYSTKLYSDPALYPDSCLYYDHCHHDTPDSILCGVGYYDGFTPVLLSSFGLLAPADSTSIAISASNVNTDSLIFSWESASNANVSASYILGTEHVIYSGPAIVDTVSRDTTLTDTVFILHYQEKYGDLWNVGGDNSKVIWNVAATDGQDTIQSTNGPFLINVDGSALSVDEESVPGKFLLYPVYPNPFNPSTTIRFQIPAGARHFSPLQLNIYDIRGRMVETLVNRKMAPGIHEITWDASNHASGVYFAVLQNGQLQQTRKLVYLK